nr:MAG TPA: hydrogenase/urease nickel incorporation protein [Caudoviricetes sp.]
MVIIMIKIEQVRIGDKIIDEITDEKGMKWYPLKKFLNVILCKYDKTASFRDSEMARYMKVFEYNPDIPGARRNIKVWCMNKTGIKFLLQNTNVKKVHRKALFEAREKGLYEACRFFEVKPMQSLDPIFLNVPPKSLSGYDTWSLLCLKNDFKISPSNKWKQCPQCNYYYPYSVRYFGKKPTPTSKCLQCQNKNFKCQNEVIQFLYEHDGLKLLAEIYSDKYKIVAMELRRMIQDEASKKKNS